MENFDKHDELCWSLWEVKKWIQYVVYINFLAQNLTTNSSIGLGDDQANWAEMWKVISKSSDARSGVADSSRPSLFDIILRANAQARRKFYLWLFLHHTLPQRFKT
jgi:hypothetical protein